MMMGLEHRHHHHHTRRRRHRAVPLKMSGKTASGSSPRKRSPVKQPKSDYIETGSGLFIHRKSNIKQTEYIVMGGKIIIEQGVTLRGDLHREDSKSPIIAIGRYCVLDANCTITPPTKTSSSTGQDANYPVKIGSYVHIGENSTIQAASIGNCVKIGKNCSIGMFSIIKDCVQIEDETIIPPYTVIAPYSRVDGKPPDQITSELPDSADQVIELTMRKRYAGIRVV